MKNLKRSISMSLLLASATLAIPFAHAEKMDAATQDMVIKRMERILSTMDSHDSAWAASEQRLADLLSERARTRFMHEIEANCDGCKGSKEDRKQAIAIYETLLKKVDINAHGPILFQLAHLYEMAGQNDKARELYENILRDARKKHIAADIVLRSHVGLGDLLFQKGKFKEAREHYVIALRDPKLENRALVIYNKAWCEFNTNQLNTAIKTLEALLAHPDQITRDNEDGKVYDAAFHTDLLRDLATFYTRRNIGESEINSYDKLLPTAHRKELLLNFSEEAGRLGQKKAAKLILDRYLQDPSLTKEERLQAFVNKAQVNYDSGHSSQSTEDFAKAAAVYQDGGCDTSDKCLQLQKDMKHYVTELHRSKKLKPDQDLLNAYMIYARTFPGDTEMVQRGAQVAQQMDQYPTAVQFYRVISSNRNATAKDKNEALWNEVAAAEKSKNPALKNESYIHYVQNSTDDKKKFEVSYQRAYLAYQQKQLKEAAVYFYDLANDRHGDPGLRNKSADLSLDSLAQIKDDQSLEKWAWEYAALFPNRRSEFETMARKSVINQVARVANDPRSSKGDLQVALEKLMKTPVANAKAAEKNLFYTNMAVLAQKLNNQDVYLQAQQALLNLPGIGTERKQALYTDIAAYYEQRLDFKQAYHFASMIKDKKTPTREREFRLGTLADLAGLNPSRHYQAALNSGLKGERADVVRQRLVLLSSHPERELKKQAASLKRSPEILNDTLLLVYARTGDAKALKSFVKMKELRHRSAAKYFASQDLYQRINQADRQLAKAQMNSRSVRALQKSTTSRVKLLNRVDALLQESLRASDITGQMLSLDLIAQENERLVKELAAVPQPKGLTPAQQNQYLAILKAKLKPFLYKAKLAQQKRQEIWKHSIAIDQMIREYKLARPEIQKLMLSPMRMLAGVSGEGRMKDSLKDALSETTISVSDLMSARQSVSQNPRNIRDIENLKNIETKIGHPLMPAYLEARLNRLEKEHSL